MNQTRQEVFIFLGLAAGVALFYWTQWLPAVALGAVLFLALAWVRLDLALIFVVFSAPFYRFPKAFGPAEFSLTEVTILLCTLAWVARRLHNRAIEHRWGLDLPPGLRPWNSPALLLLVAATISLFFSRYLHVSLREYRVVIIEPLLFYLMLVTTLRGERAVWRTVNALVLLGAGMSIFALYHYFFVGIVENTGGVRRMLGIYHSPNALGLFLGRLAPLALALGWRGRELRGTPLSGRIRGWKDGRGPGWPYLVAVLLIAPSLLLSYSRGAWLGVAAGFALVALLRGRKAVMALAGAAALAIAGAVPFLGIGRLASIVTANERLYVWQSAVRMIAERPWTGIGLDNFLYYYRDEDYMLPQAWAEPDISHPHNLVLDYWTRLGVLGVVSLAWLQVSFWRRGMRLFRALKAHNLQFVVLGLMASMADFLVHGLLDNSFFLIDLAVIFWLTYGLMEVIGKEPAAQEAR